MEITEVASPRQIDVPAGLKTIVGLLIIVGALAAGYRATLKPVTLVVDGQVRRLLTHQDTVGALLMDANLSLHPKDIVAPRPHTSLGRGETVQVRRAQPVQVVVDDRKIDLHTHATTINGVLDEAGVTLEPHDELTIEGEFPKGNPEPARILIERAVPFTLHENGQASTLYTTASTVGEALRQSDLTLYLADHIRPSMGEQLSAGMHVYVQRSNPITVQVDGRTLRTRTHREFVGDVLADLGLVLNGQDYVTPTHDNRLQPGDTLQVVRVSERFLIQQEPIPFESKWEPDPDLEIDNQRLLQEGSPGVRERRIRVRYENGHEVSRTIEGNYVAIPPQDKVMGYGTKIVIRTLDTPSGPVKYWRKMRMLATSYSAGTAGTPESSPWYGRTATGMKMRKGIVAVDPNVVSLGSQVYVPDYGVGLAGDTGSAIKGKRIDLGFDDSNLELWYRWVDVYLLAPAPPPDQIDYTLP
jgi:uncharacterized protein YabE (DUF348 family)